MSTTQSIVQKIVPLSGDSVQLIDSDNDLLAVCTPVGTLAALTIMFPLAPHPGQELVFLTSAAITSLTLSGTIDRTVTKMNAGDMFRYRYDDIDSVWTQTENSNAFDLSVLPRIYQSGVRKTNVIQIVRSAVVASGIATFYLTDNNLVSGNALFSSAVFKESANFWIDDSTSQYQMGGYTLSADRKTLTLTVNKIGLSLGIIIFTSAANGTTINLSILGN